MEYLNEFHKRTTEAGLKELAAQKEKYKTQPFDSKKAAEHLKRLVAEADRLYPSTNFK